MMFKFSVTKSKNSGWLYVIKEYSNIFFDAYRSKNMILCSVLIKTNHGKIAEKLKFFKTI
jgi:hypothetical protein